MVKKARKPPRVPSRRRPGRGREVPTVQYTVRSVPIPVDQALRRRARTEHKSLNEVLRDALIRAAGGADFPERVYTDLDSLAGAWVDVPGFDEAIEAQDRVDEALWRRRQGTPIPTNDLWIAALVVQHGLHLFARDAHFDRLPQIPRL
jgi:hypothetical protein